MHAHTGQPGLPKPSLDSRLSNLMCHWIYLYGRLLPVGNSRYCQIVVCITGHIIRAIGLTRGPFWVSSGQHFSQFNVSSCSSHERFPQQRDPPNFTRHELSFTQFRQLFSDDFHSFHRWLIFIKFIEYPEPGNGDVWNGFERAIII